MNRQGTKKSAPQIEKMRLAGRLVWEAHQAARALIAPGVTTAQLDAEVDRVISEGDAKPLFKGHHPAGCPTAFPAATCISVNQEVVHGIPGERQLVEGDVVSLDIGVRKGGWCGDAAVTHAVGPVSEENQKLLHVTEHALRLAIQEMKPNVRWHRVAQKMADYVQQEGLFVIETLVGHGIGRKLWEPPQVANYPRPGGDFKLRPGMVLAVEPMVTMKDKRVKLMADHWTFESVDGLAAAHFEHTIAITEDGNEVLTCGPNQEGWSLG